MTARKVGPSVAMAVHAVRARRERERLIDEAVRNIAQRYGPYVMVRNNVDAARNSLRHADIGIPTLNAIRAEFRRLSAA